MPPAVGLFAAIASGIQAAISAVSGLVGGWAGLGAFLASPIGSLVIGIGLQLITSLFVRKPDAPTIEAGKVNTRIPEPERWLNAGQIRQGGGILFAEFDALGNFWYLVVHSDSNYTEITKRYFDDVEIEIDVDGNIITADFCLKTNYDAISEGDTDPKVSYFQIWSTTYSESDPTPPAIAALAAAFPTKWTAEHKLVGTSYSVIRVRAVPAEHRYKVFKWRGPVGVGEPSCSIVAKWSRIFDPNDETQTNGVPTSYLYSNNSVLVWAWFRTHRYGRNKSRDSINWERIAEQALIADQDVVGLNGTFKRYQCGIAIPESKERHIAEQEILMACDAQLVFDDDGKCWPRVGYYYAPTLRLTRNRDIVAMESVEAQNGESETQGVIVRYIDPDAKYTKQPAAAWLNPLYYVEGETPSFLKIDALAIQNHNQAMRLAKSLGMRSQSAHKLLPTTGLRGLRARQERIIDLQYDNVFSGDYEIVTPVEVDDVGIFCGFGCVPIDENRFDLLPGEEKPKPVFETAEAASTPNFPANVVVSFNQTERRIEATFDEPERDDVRYEFEFATSATATEANWTPMTVDLLETIAFSGVVPQNVEYFVRWKAVTIGGKSTGWIDPPVSVVATVLVLSGTAVTTGQVGIAYGGFTIGVTGGTGPYIFSDTYGRLPAGITLNSSTGIVSGTPTTAGTYADIMLRVVDQVGNFNNFPMFTITIAP